MHRLARTQHTHTCARVYYLKTQIPVEAERPPNLKQQDTQLIMLSHKTRLSFSRNVGRGVGMGRVGGAWGRGKGGGEVGGVGVGVEEG